MFSPGSGKVFKIWQRKVTGKHQSLDLPQARRQFLRGFERPRVWPINTENLDSTSVEAPDAIRVKLTHGVAMERAPLQDTSVDLHHMNPVIIGVCEFYRRVHGTSLSIGHLQVYSLDV